MSLSLRKQAAGLPPLSSGSSARISSLNQRQQRGQCEFTPLSWTQFFKEKKLVHIEPKIVNGVNYGGDFCVYLQHSMSDFSHFSQEKPIVVFLHGCGFSGLSWARTIEETSQILGDVQMMAIDLRGHGETEMCANEDNLALDVLTNDVINVIQALFDRHTLVLVGHSLGGSLATRVAELIEEEVMSLRVIALMVVDIVEGSAIEALTTMRSVIRSRPTGFESVTKAIEWSLKSGQVRDHESARVSMPGQLIYTASNICASRNLESEVTPTETAPSDEVSKPPISETKQIPPNVIREEDEDAEAITDEKSGNDFIQPSLPQSNITSTSKESSTTSESNSKKPETSKVLTWRVDLMKTEQYWTGWFEGLSARFLKIPCPKFLLLAGVDRLDRELTIGQMQGQFQMVVLPAVGHSVQEDAPSKVADALSAFLIRHKIVEAKDGQPHVVWPGC